MEHRFWVSSTSIFSPFRILTICRIYKCYGNISKKTTMTFAFKMLKQMFLRACFIPCIFPIIVFVIVRSKSSVVSIHIYCILIYIYIYIYNSEIALIFYICFSFSFVIAINIWKMQKSCLWILCTIVSVQNWGTCKFFVMLTEKIFLLLLKLLLVNSLMFHFYSTLPFFNKVLFYDYYS